MEKDRIHQSEEEKLAHSSQNSVDTLREHSIKLDKTNQNLEDLHETLKNKSDEGLVEIAKSQKETIRHLEDLKDYIDHPEVVVRKLEEIKSAHLISNKLLKDISKKETPEAKEVDFSETNSLLRELITYSQKPIEISVNLELE